MNLKQMARESTATPLGANTYYEGEEDTTTWDEDMLYGYASPYSFPIASLSSRATPNPCSPCRTLLDVYVTRAGVSALRAAKRKRRSGLALTAPCVTALQRTTP